MKMKALKLGTIVTDSVSNVKGMLTHLMIQIGGNKEYVFQPRALNPKTLNPVPKIFVTEERITGGILEDIDVPLDILNTKGEDIGTGYKGKITTLTYHLDGCLHVELKHEGLSPEGGTYEAHEFDIRRIKGPKIKPLTAKKLEASIKDKPSPSAKPSKAH